METEKSPSDVAKEESGLNLNWDTVCMLLGCWK